MSGRFSEEPAVNYTKFKYIHTVNACALQATVIHSCRYGYTLPPAVNVTRIQVFIVCCATH